MTCLHINAPELQAPRATQAVYREDCTQCFDSIDDPEGLNVCLYCFNGGCAGERDHAGLHAKLFGHPLVLNIQRTRKEIKRDEPPQKMSKLTIAAETEEDRFNTAVKVRCYECLDNDVDKSLGKLPAVISGVKKSPTFSQREEVKAWEQEFVHCEHTLCLQQEPNKNIKPEDLLQCSMCELRENLWLCLECGNLGCGRSQFGGMGGHSHGLAHANASFHSVVVKLGSITPEGSADVFCYRCNEERVDPNLSGHLAHWGIDIAHREKTEKSLVEMQIEQNLKWEFSLVAEDGQELKPVFGAGLTGLKNLGNSCYLASIVQCLFSIPEFKQRFFRPTEEPPFVAAPAEDLETQLRKIADGLLSGRYSLLDSEGISSTDSPQPVYQQGIKPTMLKHLIGRGHDEFSTMRQQDAFELFLYLLKLISLSSHPKEFLDPVGSFQFALEQRIQCVSCQKVRYKVDQQDNICVPVPVRRLALNNQFESGEKSEGPQCPGFETVTLKECLDVFTGEEVVELTCPSCGSQDGFRKRSLFKTFPKNLAINVRRFDFELVNPVPTKLNIPIEVGDEPVDMSLYLSPGLQNGEELLPCETQASQGSSFIPNKEILDQLLGMGFPKVRSEKALHATGNTDPEAAINWLFAHMDDEGIDNPSELTSDGPTKTDLTDRDQAKITQLGDMGIDPRKARKALGETDWDVNRALDWVLNHPDNWEAEGGKNGAACDVGTISPEPPGSANIPAMFRLQSVVCHKGTSIHTGHYVAFLRKTISENRNPCWVLFNDEKVVEATNTEEMKQFAYIYFFRQL